MEQQNLALWQKIQAFSFDDPAAVTPFSAKLAATENWSASFTKKAIEEYRKFILLCCISPSGAAPSQVVDEVWHLHLTYTQSYWTDFCKNTLGKDIHHFPSTGGDQQDDKHRAWYSETLQLYRQVFETDPPTDIWPPAQQPATIITTADFPRDNKITVAIIILIVLPFLFITMCYGTPSPFSLGGPHFLVFFPMYAIAIIISYALYRHQDIKQMEVITKAHFPADASPFQLAAFLYGRHRAVQAGIVDLIKRSLLVLDDNNQFTVKKGNYTPIDNEINPLIPAFAAEADGNVVNYDHILANWYDRANFTHPALEALTRFANRRRPFLETWIFQLALGAVAIIRIIQAILNGRPYNDLLTEIFVLGVIFFFIHRLTSDQTYVHKAAEIIYAAQVQNMNDNDASILSRFALQGIPAISGFAEGILLGVVFGAYREDRLGGYGGSGGWNSCSGGSSCGSSCGGGGSSCGGCSGS